MMRPYTAELDRTSEPQTALSESRLGVNGQQLTAVSYFVVIRPHMTLAVVYSIPSISVYSRFLETQITHQYR